MTEGRYKPIPNYDGYYASADGEIWSEKSGRTLKQRKLSKVLGGYCVVTVKDQTGKNRVIGVHRLVAMTYCERKEGQTEVHHINRDKTDNRAENLVWLAKREHGKAHFVDAVDYDSPEAIKICLNCPKATCTPTGCKYIIGVRRKR